SQVYVPTDRLQARAGEPSPLLPCSEYPPDSQFVVTVADAGGGTYAPRDTYLLCVDPAAWGHRVLPVGRLVIVAVERDGLSQVVLGEVAGPSFLRFFDTKKPVIGTIVGIPIRRYLPI
ncbi:MAG: hypothetical protein ACREC6_01790, partial [Hyphomicrobiaceae bacterium]